MSKETTRRARLEPRTSRSGVLGVNCSATHASINRASELDVLVLNNENTQPMVQFDTTLETFYRFEDEGEDDYDDEI